MVRDSMVRIGRTVVLGSAGEVPDQRDQEQYEEDVENDLGNTRSSHRDSSKTQNRRNQSDNEKSDSPPYHH